MMATKIARRASDEVAGWARQAVFARAARTFIEACENEGIRVVPVKGIVSAHTLYDDPAERPLTDVDVRVVPRDVARVVRLSRSRGWPIVQRMHTYANVVVVVDDVHIDVEAHVGPPGMCGLRVDAMSSRARFTDMLGFQCRTPDFHDHAVLLVVNAFKDKLSGAFRWAIRDLERLPSRPAYDMHALVSRVRETGIATTTWIVADWLHRVRRADAWAHVRDALGHEPPRPRYVSMVTSQLDKHRDGVFTRLLARISADTPSQRVIALGAMFAWRFEVALSQLGKTPFRRGTTAPWDPSSDD